MGKKRFIDKKNAVTFQVVHRSQRDPLQADEESSKRVLVPLGHKGSSFALPDGVEPGDEDQYCDDDDSEYTSDDGEDDGEGSRTEGSGVRSSKGKERASTHAPKGGNNEFLKKSEYAENGIFYDDDYDYSQHLKPIGKQPDATFVESAKAPKKIIVGKGVSLPADIFASDREDAIGLLNRAAPTSGPQLDLDPEILAAMEEAENADDPEADFGLEEDFVAMALTEAEDGASYDVGASHNVKAGKDEYMRSLGFGGGKSGSDDEYDDVESGDDDADSGDDAEEDDGFDEDPSKLRRRFGNEETRSRFTEYSMTSSVIRRTEGLMLLDDRFEQLMAEYDEEEIGPLDSEDPGVQGLTTDMTKFDKIFDDFIEQRSIVKLEDAIKGVSASDRKLILERQKERHLAAMKRAGLDTSSKTVVFTPEDSKKADKFGNTVVEEGAQDEESDGDDERGAMPERFVIEPKPDKWDCESILSTYSNLYNHPKLITEPSNGRKRMPKQGSADASGDVPVTPTIRLSAKTGIPLGVLPSREAKGHNAKESGDSEGDDDEDGDDDGRGGENLGVARPKQETAEERKLRKQAVKAERRDRRVVKKATKEVFKKEELRQEQDALSRKANASVKIAL